MKKGTESAYPISKDIIEMCGEKPNPFGISIRLKIASSAMCALIADPSRDGSNKEYAELALGMADCLIKMEEETRNNDAV